MCSVQGFFITVGGLASGFWNASASFHLLKTLVSAAPIASLNYMFKYYHMVAWGGMHIYYKRAH